MAQVYKDALGRIFQDLKSRRDPVAVDVGGIELTVFRNEETRQRAAYALRQNVEAAHRGNVSRPHTRI